MSVLDQNWLCTSSLHRLCLGEVVRADTCGERDTRGVLTRKTSYAYSDHDKDRVSSITDVAPAVIPGADQTFVPVPIRQRVGLSAGQR
jgi:hypothetical protein